MGDVLSTWIENVFCHKNKWVTTAIIHPFETLFIYNYKLPVNIGEHHCLLSKKMWIFSLWNNSIWKQLSQKAVVIMYNIQKFSSLDILAI